MLGLLALAFAGLVSQRLPSYSELILNHPVVNEPAAFRAMFFQSLVSVHGPDKSTIWEGLGRRIIHEEDNGLPELLEGVAIYDGDYKKSDHGSLLKSADLFAGQGLRAMQDDFGWHPAGEQNSLTDQIGETAGFGVLRDFQFGELVWAILDAKLPNDKGDSCYLLSYIGDSHPKGRAIMRPLLGYEANAIRWHLNVYDGALNAIERFYRSLVSAPRQPQCDNDSCRAERAQNYRESGKRYLFFGGIRSPILGLQILILMFVGMASLVGCAAGLIGLLNDPNGNRPHRVRYWGCAIGGMAAGISFYSWAGLGHPLRVWGLG